MASGTDETSGSHDDLRKTSGVGDPKQMNGDYQRKASLEGPSSQAPSTSPSQSREPSKSEIFPAPKYGANDSSTETLLAGLPPEGSSAFNGNVSSDAQSENPSSPLLGPIPDPPSDIPIGPLRSSPVPGLTVEPPTPLEERAYSAMEEEEAGTLVDHHESGGEHERHSLHGDISRRLSKIDCAINTIRKSWDDFKDSDGQTILLPSGKKTKISPFVPQEKDYMRRPSGTLWDLKDAHASVATPASAGIKVYKRRWLMLAIFLFLGVTNTFQWIQYSIIANIVQRYYIVSSFSVDLTSMSYFLTYLIFFIPASWFVEKYGLRWALTVASSLTALGSWVKVCSVARDRFWITMVGQVIVGVGQVYTLFLPPKLASVWFGPEQVSLACSIGFIGILLGNAAGMVMPPQMVRNSDDIAQIAADLRSMFLWLAASTTAALVLQLSLFQDKPPLPPSRAQQLQRHRDSDCTSQGSDFWQTLRRLVTDPHFMILLVSWSLNVGVFCAINTLLSQLVLPFHPGHESDIGFVGLLMVASGIVGSLICGFFLDRTREFKSTTLSLYIVSLLGWGVFAFLMPTSSMSSVYITAGVYGFAMTAVQPVGLEFGAEITYPEPEGTSGAVMCAVVQLSGLVLTYVGSYILEEAGPSATMYFLGGPLLVACVMIVFMKPDLRRQAAQGAAQRHRSSSIIRALY